MQKFTAIYTGKSYPYYDPKKPQKGSVPQKEWDVYPLGSHGEIILDQFVGTIYQVRGNHRFFFVTADGREAQGFGHTLPEALDLVSALSPLLGVA